MLGEFQLVGDGAGAGALLCGIRGQFSSCKLPSSHI